jgi:lambda repressor-like predicted transcriptional regulator
LEEVAKMNVSRLKTHLMMAGKSQAELSYEARLDASVVSRAAKWGLASDNVKRKIAEVLNVPVEELFPSEDEK